jgi:molybdenum cofactor biosynthesis enzyme MoaA
MLDSYSIMTQTIDVINIDKQINTALNNLQMPKVFGLENRRDYVNEENTSSMVAKANSDFYNLALRPITLYGKDILVYPNINLQAKVTDICDSKCSFCIEKFTYNKPDELDASAYAYRLEESIVALQEQQIFPSVTITGGEPCIDIKKLEKVFDVLERNNVTKFNINTNGKLLLQRPEYIDLFKGRLPYLNISMHHWDSKKSNEIMGGCRNLGVEDIGSILEKFGGGQYGNTPRVRLQCVLLDGYVQDIASMQEYLDRTRSVGVDNVSFRGLSELSSGNYGSSKVIKMEEVLDELSNLTKEGNAQNWDFVCQNIADWYCYEDWKYGLDKNTGKYTDVHLNFSNMDNLKRYAREEKAKGKYYAREFVLFEDGVFSSSWDKDSGYLKK